MITVVKPGMLTTVQDAGRWGHQHHGVPVAGPMDPWSHARANRLVGNDASAATLEVTLLGPRLRVDEEAVVAICGGRFEARVAGEPFTIDRAVEMAAGTELDVGRCTRGARAYVAVRGGVDVPPVFGSRATHLPSAMGGVSGRALAAGDRLPIGALARTDVDWRAHEGPAMPDGEASLRVLAGPDDDDALAACRDALVGSRFQISPESNRMGYRLRGAALDVPPAVRLSAATPVGTIQVPENGAPIVLMADRQTTGGYARVATVITADLGLAGQLKPGDWMTFTICSHDEALSALRARRAELDL